MDKQDVTLTTSFRSMPILALSKFLLPLEHPLWEWQ